MRRIWPPKCRPNSPPARGQRPSFRLHKCGTLHTCGIATDERAYCWGMGLFGQRGTGSKAGRTSPEVVVAGICFNSVSGGLGHTFGTATDGTAYCWGNGTEGQLGKGGTSSHLTPHPVAPPQ